MPAIVLAALVYEPSLTTPGSGTIYSSMDIKKGDYVVLSMSRHRLTGFPSSLNFTLPNGEPATFPSWDNAFPGLSPRSWCAVRQWKIDRDYPVGTFYVNWTTTGGETAAVVAFLYVIRRGELRQFVGQANPGMWVSAHDLDSPPGSYSFPPDWGGAGLESSGSLAFILLHQRGSGDRGSFSTDWNMVEEEARIGPDTGASICVMAVTTYPTAVGPVPVSYNKPASCGIDPISTTTSGVLLEFVAAAPPPPDVSQPSPNLRLLRAGVGELPHQLHTRML